MNLSRAILLLPVFSALATACGPDREVSVGPPPTEHGRWGVSQAFRDGQETHMIDVAYFEFDTARRRLTTNFTGEESVIDYRRDEQGIETMGNRYFKRMNFEALTDSSLQVTADVSGYYFRILLMPQGERINRELVGPGE